MQWNFLEERNPMIWVASIDVELYIKYVWDISPAVVFIFLKAPSLRLPLDRYSFRWSHQYQYAAEASLTHFKSLFRNFHDAVSSLVLVDGIKLLRLSWGYGRYCWSLFSEATDLVCWDYSSSFNNLPFESSLCLIISDASVCAGKRRVASMDLRSDPSWSSSTVEL